MTDLWHSLQGAEFSFLRIVAECWGLPFAAPDARRAVDELAASLLSGEAVLDAGAVLSGSEQQALIWLDGQGGRAPWDQFTRKFGQVRQMGAGRMDREKPHRNPLSPAEGLWYRALVARGFFESETGPQEFAYLPEDLRDLIMPILHPERVYQSLPKFICRAAAPRERASTSPASQDLLDHLSTLLAAVRLDHDPSIHLPDVSLPEKDFYLFLARQAGLLDAPGRVSPQAIRQFFDLEDPGAVDQLWQCWLRAREVGELQMLPDIQIEGELVLDHRQVRETALSYLDDLGAGEWWSLESFVSQVKERNPDFVRSGGDYQAWFIRGRNSEDFLSGFEHWDDVEGALLRYLLSGPLHWLGLADLGEGEEGTRPLSFRLTPSFLDFRAGKAPVLPPRTPEQIQIRSQGEIRITPLVPRKVRYQIARFCDWYPLKADAYQYRVSPASLTRAEAQGLRVAHLLSLLENHAEAVPPNILAALQRWEKGGSQASIAPKVLMRVGSPAVLKALKKSPAGRFILEQLGPTVVIIRPGSQEKVAQALMELGFFVQIEDQSGSQT